MPVDPTPSQFADLAEAIALEAGSLAARRRAEGVEVADGERSTWHSSRIERCDLQRCHRVAGQLDLLADL
ncbi:hypothetical protein IAE22_34435, partial [Bacillus sp. S34]|nr:hypothetical protein [Bacillus sp. S34]